jgi:two-component system sensor histidine kinase RegB
VLLRSQLALCREILHKLRAQAAGDRIRQPLSGLLGHAVERMQLMHPRCAFALALDLADRPVEAPATLPQVLVNLVDNAAQAAQVQVALRAAEDADGLLLEIRDDGPGIAPEVAGRLGEPFVSGRADGLGIGYFLSHASVNQWGGSIHLQARPEGGTLTTLRLPWAVLRPAREGR